MHRTLYPSYLPVIMDVFMLHKSTGMLYMYLPSNKLIRYVNAHVPGIPLDSHYGLRLSRTLLNSLEN